MQGHDGDDVLTGSDGKDEIKGHDGDDQLHGRGGSDKLEGGEGDDTLYGDAGDDTLKGGEGDDLLSGGAGSDSAYGGEGADTYVADPFSGHDYFDGGEGGWTDAIDISAAANQDVDSPWTIEVDGVQVDYDLAAGALDLNPEAEGSIVFNDGSEISFEGVERIEW